MGKIYEKIDIVVLCFIERNAEHLQSDSGFHSTGYALAAAAAANEALAFPQHVRRFVASPRLLFSIVSESLRKNMRLSIPISCT